MTGEKEELPEPKTLQEVLVIIQKELKANKSQYNSFGGYYYRNCEDILDALKTFLDKYQCFILLNDDLVSVKDRFYIKATASLHLVGNNTPIRASALAREPDQRKGMDASQITGTASSYARKYALNALFAIDDAKDADAQSKKQEMLNAAMDRNSDSIVAIKDAIAEEDYSRAYECWYEITEEDKKALWVAPTKFDNPPFTTDERKVFKSNEWSAARTAYHGNNEVTEA